MKTWQIILVTILIFVGLPLVTFVSQIYKEYKIGRLIKKIMNFKGSNPECVEIRDFTKNNLWLVKKHCLNEQLADQFKILISSDCFHYWEISETIKKIRVMIFGVCQFYWGDEAYRFENQHCKSCIKCGFCPKNIQMMKTPSIFI